MNTENKYTRVAVLLHWAIGLLILAQIALGFWMEGLPKTPPGLRAGWFNLHKSIGIVVGLLVLVRIYWRVTHRPPELPSSLAVWQKKLSHAAHHLLYVLMVLIPVSGFMGSAYSKYPIKFFGLELPKFFEYDHDLKEFYGEIHETTVWVLIAVLALHILAALKHRLIDKDTILQRMSFKR